MDFCVSGILHAPSVFGLPCITCLESRSEPLSFMKALRARIDNRCSHSQRSGEKNDFLVPVSWQSRGQFRHCSGRRVSLACVLLVDRVHVLLALLSGFLKNSQASGVIFIYLFHINMNVIIIILLYFCRVETGPSHYSQLRTVMLPFLPMDASVDRQLKLWNWL